MAIEHIDGGRLSDLGSTGEHLLAAAVEGLDVDDEVAIAHTDILDLHLELDPRQDHANEGNVVATITIYKQRNRALESKYARYNEIQMALCDGVLDVLAGGRARPHAVGDRAGKRGVVGEVEVDVDGVEVARDLRVQLVGRGRGESRAGALTRV